VNNYENIREVEIEFEEQEKGLKTYRKVISLYTPQAEREIFVQKLSKILIIIISNQIMSRNIQEYLNNLVNKPRVYYLDLNNYLTKQEHNCPNCSQRIQSKCDNCQTRNRQLTGEITSLSEFSNLKGINVSNNQLANLNFLNSLPNKDKLKGINLFGNQIKEVDFAELFAKFPNLEKLNLQNNPTKAKNLTNLTSEQLTKLIKGIKEQKIRIDSFKGTILTDLLAYVNELVRNGNTQHAHTSHYLQTLVNHESMPTKEHKPHHNSLLIGGLTIFGLSAVLGIGYLWGKKNKAQEYE